MRRVALSQILGLLLMAEVSISSAQAYIPPSSFILKTWIGKRHHQKKLRVKSLIYAGDRQASTAPHFKEIFFITEAQTLKSWAVDDQDQVLFYREKPLKEISLAAQLFFGSDVMELGRNLRSKGIPVLFDQSQGAIEQESLLRIRETVSWVVGEKPIQSGTPQLWFEKDTFLPLRLVYSASAEMDKKSFEFDHFRRDLMLPRSLSVQTGSGKPVLNVQVAEMGLLGDPGKGYHSQAQGWTTLGENISSETRELIRVYYESLR